MPTHGIRVGLRLAFGAATAAVIVLSLLPSASLPPVGVSDKLQHLAAYAMLAGLGAAAFPTRRGATGLMLFLPLLGIALESLQAFVPGRSAEVADALINGLGACLVLGPVHLRHSRPWTRRRRRGQRRGAVSTEP